MTEVTEVDFLDWRHLISNLKIFIKDNLNGQSPTPSLGNLWGLLLLKSYFQHTDLSLNGLGMWSSLQLVSTEFSCLLHNIYCNKNKWYIDKLISRMPVLKINRPLVENGKNPQKYIRYTPEDLEHMLGEFFEGKTLNEPRR